MPYTDNRPRLLRTAVAIAVFAVMSLAPAPAAHAAADTTPPTVPGVPVFSQVTPFSATLTWQRSTDNVGVTNYLVRRALPTGGNWTESTRGANSITILHLTPNNNYTFTVLASDAAGNYSAPSPVGIVRTQPYTAGPMCSVTYQPITSSGGFFYSQITMTNLTTGPWQEWTLGFTLTPAQRINPGWGFRQDGTRWTQTLVSLWSSGSGPLMPGASRPTAFAGTYTGATNPPPTEFTINDQPCTVTGPPA